MIWNSEGRFLPETGELAIMFFSTFNSHIWNFSDGCTFQFDSDITDYLHTCKFPIMRQLGKWGLRTAILATLVGVYQFNTNDVGQ